MNKRRPCTFVLCFEYSCGVDGNKWYSSKLKWHDCQHEDLVTTNDTFIPLAAEYNYANKCI